MYMGAPESLIDPRPSVVAIVGPTAVGKTEIALSLAERINGEIVSADSRLFYRGMDIGTAKPTVEDRARIAHHLIDIAGPGEVVSLAVFQRLAQDAISDILRRARLPQLVGGTGQYLRAVTGGWLPPSVRPHPGIRGELGRLAAVRGGQWLHQRLQALDSAAASSIDVRNVRRTIRALEVILVTGHRFSAQRAQKPPSYRIVTIGLKRPRHELFARIDARIEDMWRLGLLDETRRLVKMGYGPEMPGMSAIGYSQCIRVLRGEMGIDDAKADMRRATRAFVRRQANWFRETDPQIAWFDAAQAGIVDEIERYVRQVIPPPGKRDAPSRTRG